MDATVSVVDIDPNFEPQTRARSNTWPCRPVEDLVEGQQVSPASDDPGVTDHTKDVLGIKQKTSSRRNAWGNLSYADLITKAIQSSPEQRLTLSQIYDWMVQNVPYFKDKGDNTSSAGWKNSIRHNLSLHSRFMRIQNEGTGKSSWWVINPDAKPGKAPRRRAGSMETKNLEKKRGRIRKRIEAIRANQENGSFSNEDFQDLHYNLNLSPEFRTRAGSNASSCGRLSPIQAAVEPDLHENQVPPMSPIPWDSESEPLDSNSRESFSIVDSLVGISLNLQESSNDQNDVEMLGESSVKQQLMSPSSYQFTSQNNYDNNNYGNLPAPPSYSDHLQQKGSPQPSVLDLDSMTSQARGYQNMGTKHLYAENLLTKQRQMQGSPSLGSPSSNALGINTQQLGSPSRSPQLSPSNYHSPGGYNSPQTMKRSPQQMIAQQQQQQQQQIGGGTRSLLQQCLEAPDDSMLRQALTQQQLNPTYQQSRLSPLHQQQQPPQQQQYGHFNNVYSNAQLQGMGNTTMNMNTYTNSLNMASQSGLMNNVPQMNSSQMGQIIPPHSSNASLSEIDTEPMLDLDYDVEQLLRQELALDSNLDFNFDSSPQTQNVSTSDSQNLVR